jgi:hypothetical protein
MKEKNTNTYKGLNNQAEDKKITHSYKGFKHPRPEDKYLSKQKGIEWPRLGIKPETEQLSWSLITPTIMWHIML